MSTESHSKTFMVWWVCGLLLLASTINYMDRQTLSILGSKIRAEFNLSNTQFGHVEFAFGYAFATGSLVFGVISDRVNIRWLYPLVLTLWSLMGVLTGFSSTFMELVACRILLGLFEAGHWPCALITTHRLLPPQNRTLGNSVLQSGAAIGAMFTPPVIAATSIFSQSLTGTSDSWRPAFWIIGGIGIFWVFAWLALTRSSDLRAAPATHDSSMNGDANDTLISVITSRKFAVMVVVVIAINACWHILRVWMPMFLEKGREFSQKEMYGFMFFYYLMNDVGCLGSGFLSRLLSDRGFSVYWSRAITFGICSVMVATGVLLPWCSGGPILMIILFLMAMGSLGLFPCYYSFSQELSTRHKGKVLGLMGTIAWLTSSCLHPLLGMWADKTKSYDAGLAISCGLPVIAFVVLTLCWPGKSDRGEPALSPA